MNKPLAFSVIALAITAFTVSASKRALSNTGQASGLVRLQTTTPGAQQMGHISVSGTITGSQFAGGGAAITGVNADSIDGIDSSAFLQTIPNPLSLNGATNQATILGTSSSPSGIGISGVATATSGINYGGLFSNASEGGAGIISTAGSPTGNTFGGRFQSYSTSGVGLIAESFPTTGITFAGLFHHNSNSGSAIMALALGSSGQTTGGRFQNYSSAGTAVSGEALALAGTNYAGEFLHHSEAGAAIVATAFGADGFTYGGRFINYSASGTAVSGESQASSGTLMADDLSITVAQALASMQT